MNVRVGSKTTHAGDIILHQDNKKMSEEAADFGAACAEAVAEGIVKGACPIP